MWCVCCDSSLSRDALTHDSAGNLPDQPGEGARTGGGRLPAAGVSTARQLPAGAGLLGRDDVGRQAAAHRRNREDHARLRGYVNKFLVSRNIR